MRTVSEILSLSYKYLAEKSIDNARKEAGEIIAHCLGMNRIDLYMSFERPVIERELEIIRDHLKRRGANEPLSYIHKEISFYGCTIALTPDVLIPRQETEIIVDKIVQSLKGSDLKGKILYDICTGSGCIGIALKKQFPELKVYLSDISEKALKVAKINADQNQTKVTLIQGDLFQPFKRLKADFIICNPPYISEDEYVNLENEVKLYEPKLALVASNQGLECYERFADGLRDYLNPNGKCYLEIGYNQKSAITNIFSKQGYKKFNFEKDWAGLDRLFFLEIE